MKKIKQRKALNFIVATQCMKSLNERICTAMLGKLFRTRDLKNLADYLRFKVQWL